MSKNRFILIIIDVIVTSIIVDVVVTSKPGFESQILLTMIHLFYPSFYREQLNKHVLTVCGECAVISFSNVIVNS